ncbi:MAG: amino acid adenylation domain-containing protein [Chloroflexota bacterium]
MNKNEASKTSTASSDSSEERIPAVPRQAVYPLSFAQQRLWFLEHLEGASATYAIPLLFHLTGPLDRAALQTSFQQLLDRHAVLRTTIALHDGTPAQTVHPTTPFPLPLCDLCHLSPPQRDDLLTHLSQRPFDLATGPLLRVALFRLTPHDHLLLLALHHIAADGWSMSILAHELQSVYHAVRHAQPATLPPLPIQYTDFAIWQRQRATRPAYHTQLAYWTTQLAQLPAALALPTDFPRPSHQTFAGCVHTHPVPQALCAQLHQWSTHLQMTPFMLWLAACHLLLARYSGQPDIVVGTPIAGRTHPDLRSLIGCFINTLAIRSTIAATTTGQTLLAQVRETVLAAFDHQEVPFEQIVQALQLPRELHRTPVFQVLLLLQTTPQTSFAFEGLTVTAVPMTTATAKFDLTINLVEQSDTWVLQMEYNTDLFTAATIARMQRHYLRLVEQLLLHSEEPVWQLSYYTLAEQQQLLSHAIPPQMAAPRANLLALVQAQVQRTPIAPAVVDGQTGQSWSYGAVWTRAIQLAHRLRQQGIGSGSLVGVCVPRTADLVVGLLGILQAGAGYVPLDPAYPPERLQFILDDANVSLVLTDQTLHERLETVLTGYPQLLLDADAVQITRQPTAAPAVPIHPEAVAYIIYTSGSTGRPKGVMIRHHSLTHLLHWAHATYDHATLAGVLAGTSLCFDLSVFELFAPLCWGGTVLLVASVLDLPTAACPHPVTLLNTVPSAAAALLAQQQIPHSVHTINLAGEPVPPDLLTALLALPHVQQVYNLYGPSEDTTYSTAACLTTDQSTAVPIGVPLPGTQLLLLDPAGLPVPPGVVGEIYLTGCGLAQGYLQRPTTTASRFLPHPAPASPGQRLYRTGDLAHSRADGTLTFLGRLDHQVKVRGYRIELGEIESCLRQHPHVAEAVVVVQPGPTGDPHLVAYVCGPDEVPLLVAALRTHLQTHLPGYMVPSRIHPLTAIPRTPNGKVDRQQLPVSPSPSVAPAPSTAVPPADALEHSLVEIWEALLPVQPIGVTSSFFELGGHSLLAIQVMAAIQQRFGRTVPVSTLFRAPTIRALAHTLRQPLDQETSSTLVCIRDGVHHSPFFYIHPVGGEVLCYAALAQQMAPHWPVYGLQYGSPTTEVSEYNTIEGLAYRYVDALRKQQPHGPYYLGGWSLGGVIAFEMAQHLLREHQEEVALLVLIDSYVVQAGNEQSVPNDIDELEICYSFAHDLCQLLDVQPIESHLGTRDSADFLRDLLYQLQQAGKMSSTYTYEDMLVRYRTFRSNTLGLMHYRPSRYLHTVVLLQAEDVPEQVTTRASTGWETVVQGQLTIRNIVGNHYSLLRFPHVRELAHQINTFLDDACPISTIGKRSH